MKRKRTQSICGSGDPTGIRFARCLPAAIALCPRGLTGDDAGCRHYRDRDMATSMVFEGHMKWAEAMS